MAAWFSLFQDTLSISHSGPTNLHTISFEVPKGTEQLRIYSSSQFVSLSSKKLNLLYSQYTSHPAVSPEHKKTFRPIFDQLYLHHFRGGFTLHFYDSEEQFRGRWDPSFQEVKEIQRFSASNGFVAGPISPGEWSIVVFMADTQNQTVELSIQIDATEEPGEAQPPPSWHPVPQVQAGMGKRQWLIGELHEHTTRSTGHFSPEETVHTYFNFGFGFLALTDHDHQPLSGLLKEPRIGLIVGQEIETPLGHALSLGIRERITPYENNHFLDISTLISLTHKQDGLFCALHPFALDADGKYPSWRWMNTDWHQVDLLEVWPGKWKERFPEVLKALDFWDSLLNQEIPIFAICGKGGHIEMNEECGMELPKTVLLTEGTSETALLTALKLGRFYMTIEPAVSLWAETHDQVANLGGEITLRTGQPFLLHLECNQLDRAYVRIKSSQGVILEMPLSSVRDTHHQFTLRAETGFNWYRAEVYRYQRPMDELLALTNPVFVRGMLAM